MTKRKVSEDETVTRELNFAALHKKAHHAVPEGLCTCVRAYVRASARVCVCVCVCVCAFVCLRAYVRACVQVLVCARAKLKHAKNLSN